MTDEILPSSADLTAQLRQFHAERNLEREATDFPFRGVALAPIGAMRQVAADLIPQIKSAIKDNIPDLTEEFFRLAQVAKHAEEAGEALKAYLRWVGASRKSGTLKDVLGELADSVISAFIAAELLEGDLPSVIETKLAEVYSRGWSA